MNISDLTLKYDEKVIFNLRSIYEKYGFSRFKMSKFEEYDLYVKNKDFLISDSVITFTDTNGKLMALKPDVTLSIIKNSKKTGMGIQKVYYDENVYRVSSGTHSFKELMQVGLECIGDIDNYCVSEVLLLACESLKSISPVSVLDVSHLGIISAVMDKMDISSQVRIDVMRCIGQKNIHEMKNVLLSASVDNVLVELLSKVVSLYGKPSVVLPRLQDVLGEEFAQQIEELKAITDAVDSDILRLDFSVVNDIDYYNGIVFKGFIEGVPEGVLSGGRYDRLMKKMNSKMGAIGFAVYLDVLERILDIPRKYDADVVLLYTDKDALKVVKSAVQQLNNNGEKVLALKSVPEKLRYKKLAKINGNEVEILEDNA